MQKYTCQLILSAIILLPFFGLTGCDANNSNPPPAVSTPPTPVVKGPEEFFSIKVGTATAHIQLAITIDEQRHGLMERTDLGSDDGMIFIYTVPQRMSFWMRNTPTPLDIGFFDAEGILREIYPLQAYDETPISSKSRSLLYALEMKQGWYAARNVRPGDKLDLTALGAALKARGVDTVK